LSNFQSDKLVVIGVGLIGGSVAAALRRAGKVRRITGVAVAPISNALALGVVDRAVGVCQRRGSAARGAFRAANDRVLSQLQERRAGGAW
jgi:prephenate dehydrogenase